MKVHLWDEDVHLARLGGDDLGGQGILPQTITFQRRKEGGSVLLSLEVG